MTVDEFRTAFFKRFNLRQLVTAIQVTATTNVILSNPEHRQTNAALMRSRLRVLCMPELFERKETFHA